MSTDRELVEMAAKASGREGEWVDFAGMDISVGYQGGLLCGDADSSYYWNPLKSDGDAFRLETEMSFTVLFWDQGVEVGASEFVRAKLRHISDRSAYERYSFHGGDKNAARRKASTLAAAKIGRATP